MIMFSDLSNPSVLGDNIMIVATTNQTHSVVTHSLSPLSAHTRFHTHLRLQFLLLEQIRGCDCPMDETSISDRAN